MLTDCTQMPNIGLLSSTFKKRHLYQLSEKFLGCSKKWEKSRSGMQTGVVVRTLTLYNRLRICPSQASMRL